MAFFGAFSRRGFFQGSARLDRLFKKGVLSQCVFSGYIYLNGPCGGERQNWTG